MALTDDNIINELIKIIHDILYNKMILPVWNFMFRSTA